MQTTGSQDPRQASLGSEFAGRGLSVGVAESLTGGLLASRFARAEGASTWFRGGIVAYNPDVKREVLRTGPGPVVTRKTVLEMARGVARLLTADLSVAVSGVGGPDPQDGVPPGTVWIAVVVGSREVAELHNFDGDPDEVCSATCDAAVALALRVAREWQPDPATPPQ
jgi:nicotinamide-nucleotide amidase